jgi:hypothetical protein
MLNKCVECDHLLVDGEVECLHKGKSYCDDERNNKNSNGNCYNCSSTYIDFRNIRNEFRYMPELRSPYGYYYALGPDGSSRRKNDRLFRKEKVDLKCVVSFTSNIIYQIS